MRPTSLLDAPEINVHSLFRAHRCWPRGRQRALGRSPAPKVQRELWTGWKMSTHPRRRVLKLLS